MMFDFTLLWFAGLWPIIGHYSFWVLAMGACGVLIWLRPALWKPAAYLAAIITAGTICYAFGVNDGKNHAIAQCELEKKLAIDGAARARAKAQRTLTRKPLLGGVPNNADRRPDCRDC